MEHGGLISYSEVIVYRRFFVLCLSCVLCFLSGCSAKKEASEQMTDVVVIQNTMAELSAANVTEAAVEKLIAPFVEDMDYDIKSFVRQFYDYLASGEYDLAMYMTNDSTNLDRDKFMELSSYIESVKSLTCYMMDGMVDGSYIVVAKCGVLTTLGAQVVTMLNAFYICTNESGTYYICGNDVGDEVRSYNSIMLSAQTIEDIEEQVRLDNAAAVLNQHNLKEIQGIVIFDDVTRFLYEQQTAE